MPNSISMETEAPSRDFPAEQVWLLLEELFRTFFEYLAEKWTNKLGFVENNMMALMVQLRDVWSIGTDFANDTIRFLVSKVPAGSNLATLLRHLEENFLAFRRRPLWFQAIIVCCSILVTISCQAVMRQHLRKRHKRRRRRLSMKKGRSEIQQGRTSLVYGAAGDLMDEEYLEEVAAGEEDESGGRGRFGTFDFFGINTTSTPGKRRNRTRSQSFGDDNPLWMGGYNKPRQRTRSTESLGGNPSGAAVVRSRSDSMESLSDTLGGFFSSFKNYRQNATAGRINVANQTKNSRGNNIANEKQTQFRKERLGSMDIYFAPGKNRPPALTIANDDSLKSTRISALMNGMSTRVSALIDGLDFEVEVEDDYKHFDDDDEMRYMYDEFGIVTLSHKVKYHGPFRSKLNCGSTLVPPLPFEVISRKIAPPEIDLPLKRILEIDLLKGALKIVEPTTSASLNQKFDLIYDDIDKVSLKFQAPPEGAVLYIYKKGTLEFGPDWKEHTFDSAHAAAQFQLDFLAYQVLGKPLRHIFEALHLVHQGSLTCEGQEFVLHDKFRDDGESGENSGKGEGGIKDKPDPSVETAHCVAWDDAMRAMSSIPSVRIALERLWLSHKRTVVIERKSATNPKGKSSFALENEKVSAVELSLLKDEYIKERLLLGPVDFFRLFVPTVPETAIPEGDFNNQERTEQLLCWRKRVARASVLVRSYTRARMVANRGWNLDRRLPAPGTSAAAAGSALTGILGDHGGEQIAKRFAYDENENNHVRDVSARNEIYEASVSRDVLCHVRPYNYLSHNESESQPSNSDDGITIIQNSESDTSSGDDNQSQQHFVLSPYQAYTYIESHYFKTTDKMLDEEGPLHPSRDPIEIFPSLKDIIVRHPDLDFFVHCLNNPEDKILIVNLHVRSLAKGIDPQFDNVIDRFSKANEETRKRKLYLMVQLGNKIGFSFLGSLFLKLLSFYFRYTATCRDSPMNLESTRDRYGFPGFRVGGLFKTYHFGGSLQKDPKKPSNYIGLTKCTSSYYESFVGKIILDKLQRNFFESTVDLTYVIEGATNDELPERALSSLRIVHVNPNRVSKDPRPYLAVEEDSKITRKSSVSLSQRALQYSWNSVRSLVHSGFLSPETSERSTTSNALSVIREVEEESVVAPTLRNVRRKDGTVDPPEEGIDLVVGIMRSVMIPCRRKTENLGETGLVVVKPVAALRMVDRSDIVHFLAEFDFDVRIASERLAETASWRGTTFPIDKRMCRIELQNGQFFQQGFDKNKNPVFYFRNLCRGPWRGDSEATILAILYRFDKSLKSFCKVNPYTKVTLIVLMGRAKRGARIKENHGDSNEVDSVDDGDFEIYDESNEIKGSAEDLFGIPSEEEMKVHTGNPRISPDEKWNCHTNTKMLKKLFEIFAAHYPGRLSRILVVKGRGKNHYYRDRTHGRSVLRKLLSGIDKEGYQLLMRKIQFVHKTSALTEHVELKNLPTFVGGIAPIHHSAYEF